jgi:hypothetical protein
MSAIVNFVRDNASDFQRTTGFSVYDMELPELSAFLESHKDDVVGFLDEFMDDFVAFCIGEGEDPDTVYAHFDQHGLSSIAAHLSDETQIENDLDDLSSTGDL